MARHRLGEAERRAEAAEPRWSAEARAPAPPARDAAPTVTSARPRIPPQRRRRRSRPMCRSASVDSVGGCRAATSSAAASAMRQQRQPRRRRDQAVARRDRRSAPGVGSATKSRLAPLPDSARPRRRSAQPRACTRLMRPGPEQIVVEADDDLRLVETRSGRRAAAPKAIRQPPSRRIVARPGSKTCQRASGQRASMASICRATGSARSRVPVSRRKPSPPSGPAPRRSPAMRVVECRPVRRPVEMARRLRPVGIVEIEQRRLQEDVASRPASPDAPGCPRASRAARRRSCRAPAGHSRQKVARPWRRGRHARHLALRRLHIGQRGLVRCRQSHPVRPASASDAPITLRARAAGPSGAKRPRATETRAPPPPRISSASSSARQNCPPGAAAEARRGQSDRRSWSSPVADRAVGRAGPARCGSAAAARAP